MLKKLSHDMHSHQLLEESDQVESVWAEAVKVSKTLVDDIDVGSKRLNALAKPYASPFDSAIEG
eukprot:1706051-Pyramimonas_sp.AAC.1